MSKRNYKFGGNVHETVPASRQNIEQRTPSGVRPVSSPVIPVAGVSGKMKNGGEVKNMKKPKKMAFGGPAGPAGKLPQQRGGTVTTMPPAPVAPGMAMPGRGTPFTTRGPGGQRPLPPGLTGPGGPPRGGNFGGGPGMYVGPGGGMPPGAGGMPMGGPGLATMPGGGVDQGGYADFIAQRNAVRPPAMKKGGKVSASSYRDMTGGAGGGIGRLEKTSIASKTKAQKMKKGGKVRYYDGGITGGSGENRSSGGDYLNEGDRLALEKAGFDPETRMKRSGSSYGKAPYESAELPPRKKKSSGPKAVDPETGGIRMTPSQKRAAAAEMGVTLDENRYGDSERGNGPGAYGPDSSPKKSPASQKREAAGDAIRSYGAKDPKKAADALMKLYGRKMAKGGKAEAFEGTAKDMAQDKKLAKKRGMSLKAWEKSSADEKHDTQRNMKGLKKGGKASAHEKGCKCMACGGMAKYAMGGKVSTAQDGMKPALRPKPSAMAKGGAVGKTFGKPLPGTKLSSQKIRATTATGASLKKDGMKGQLRAKASGAKPTNMMKPLGMTKMAKGGKVRGAGIAQRGTKFIGEV